MPCVPGGGPQQAQRRGHHPAAQRRLRRPPPHRQVPAGLRGQRERRRQRRLVRAPPTEPRGHAQASHGACGGEGALAPTRPAAAGQAPWARSLTCWSVVQAKHLARCDSCPSGRVGRRLGLWGGGVVRFGVPLLCLTRAWSAPGGQSALPRSHVRLSVTGEAAFTTVGASGCESAVGAQPRPGTAVFRAFLGPLPAPCSAVGAAHAVGPHP